MNYVYVWCFISGCCWGNSLPTSVSGPIREHPRQSDQYTGVRGGRVL